MNSVSRIRRCVIGLAIVVFVMGWVVVLPHAASGGGYVSYNSSNHTYTIWPSGVDDTANIRAAFAACGSTPGCTIQLGAGTFHTAQVIVHDFNGVFRGNGAHETIVEALPNMPISDLIPFYLYPSTYDQPWPMFFDFYDGAYAISDLTFSVPSPTPTEAWWDENTNAYIHSLNSILEINGVNAVVSITRIAVLGGPGEMGGAGVLDPNGLNNYIGFVVQGFTHEPGAPLPYDALPLKISLKLTNSEFSMINGMGVWGLEDSILTIRGNTFTKTRSSLGALLDSSRSVAVVSNNLLDGQGVFAGQGLAKVPPAATLVCLEPSQVVVSNNDIWLDAGASGVQALDLGELYGCERSLDLVVSNNNIRGDPTSAMGVFSLMARSAVITGNEISVPQQGVYMLATSGVINNNQFRDTAMAIMLEMSMDVRVEQNEIRGGLYGIYLSGASSNIIAQNELNGCDVWGIALEAGSSDNMIVKNEVRRSGAYDLYWDQTGSGNVWRDNEYKTSDPPGL